MSQKEQTASLISVGRLQETDWKLGPQSHPHWEMVFVLSGRLNAHLLGRDITAGSGDVLLYPADVEHTEWSTPGKPLALLFIAFSWPDAPSPPPLLFSDERGRLRVIAEWLIAERESRTRSSSHVNAALLQSMLAECRALWEPHDPDLVERMRRYIEQNLAEHITLADIAAELGLSRYHLIRKYQALAGHTPMAEVTRIRLERARDLILTTDLPLKAIAPRVGLTDVYRLGRLFRRYLDITPGSLRRRAPISNR